MGLPGRRGSTPAATMVGTSRAASLSALVRLDKADKAFPSRCPPTAAPPSWEDLTTTRTPGRRGSTPAAATSGRSRQGVSVALSADGNTAIVGGPHDNSTTGAAWVYTRRGGIWTPQGSKLVGTGAAGSAGQGGSVALSADGTVAIVGGPHDNSFTGAAWVSSRSGGIWSQQGSKLVGTGAVGNADQGWSVALSADGNTAIVGGFADNSYTGAVWVYTRSSGVWTQQGSKLVGVGAVGNADQGWSVALSADGNTVVVGGPRDNAYSGAAWVYSRGGSVWTQQGNKLI